MVEEPDNKMEKVLRNYAGKRREGAEPSLHPATRRMLLDEVKRTYPRSEAPPRKNWLRALFPHLAIVAAVSVVLGVAVMMLRENREAQVASAPEQLLRPTESAKKELAEAAQPEQKSSGLADERVIPAPVASAPKSVVTLGLDRELNESRKDQSAKLSDAAGAKPASPVQLKYEDGGTIRRYGLTIPVDPLSTAESNPSPAREESVAPGNVAADSVLTITANRVQEPAIDAPAEIILSKAKADTELSFKTPLAQVPVGDAAKPLNLGAAYRRDFVALTNPVTSRLASSSNLFSRFQLEQIGEQVRFTEQDGAVYVGTILSRDGLAKDFFSEQNQMEAQTRSRTAGLRPASLTTATNVPSPAGTAAWLFRATGFNQALGRQLIFEGQFFDPTNRLGTNGVSATNAGALQVPLVIGRFTGDGTNWAPVRATSPR